MRSALKYILIGLLCVALVIPCACSSKQADAPTASAQPPAVTQQPEIPSDAPSEPAPVQTPDTPKPEISPEPEPTTSGDTPALHPNQETLLEYTLDGVEQTIPAVLHHTHHGYSIVYDAMHYESRGQFELDSYWSDVGLYLSVSLIYNVPLDYVLDGLQLQENIEMGAQPTYVGAGLYPAYTLYHTDDFGCFRQFWALEYGSDTMLIERSYPVDHEYAEFHHTIQDAMLSTLTLDNADSSVTRGMSSTYASVLEDILFRQKLPDGRRLDYSETFGDISENRFALYDIDMDGKTELLFEYSTSTMVGMTFLVYDYEESTDSLTLQFECFPGVQFFDNGIVEVSASHNHSYSGVIWPYALYQYDAVSDSYTFIGSVSGWDKLIKEEDFPDHIDGDGDGLVYYISAEGFDPEVPVDGADYFTWRSFYMNAAESLWLPFVPLTAESIAPLK